MTDQVGIEKGGLFLQLADIEKDCWTELVKGSEIGRHPFHQPAFANCNNLIPEIRTVVLRAVLPNEKQLHIHTDCRSPKYNQVKQSPRVSLLFYDFNSQLQIRVSATATLHTDDHYADEAWKNTRVNSRKTYMIQQGPSTISAAPVSGLEERFISRDPTEAESEKGRINFCVVRCRVDTIDWLWLNSKGHKRARFTYLDNKLETLNWLIP